MTELSLASIAALDAVQTELGVLVTAYGCAIAAADHATPSDDLARARVWAMAERARLLDALGRPAEADRIRARHPVAARAVAA